MSDTSGRSSPLPLMRFDLASSSWRTCEDTSLWDLVMSSPSFPEWGTTRGGVLFELPTPARPTVEQGSSSLPTPKASDGERGTDLPRLRPDERSRELATVVNCLPTPHAGLGERGRDGVYPNERGQQDLQHAISALLPTPTASDTNGIGSHGTGGPDLRTAMSLLPTPRAAEAQHLGRSVPAKPGQQQGLTETVNLLPTPRATRGGSATETVNLLPTPRAQNGEERNQNISARPADQPQNLENALALLPTGVSTHLLLRDGSESSVEQHQTPPSSEPTDDHDSTLFSWSG